MNKRTLIPTLSLFSGAGGLDLGFVAAGFEIVACVEIEEAYCKTLNANQENQNAFGSRTKVHCEDIRLFDVTPYKNAGIRCVIGGPPCQTFSAAGRRSGGVIGTEDERGQLFRAYCRILQEIEPETFVFENVYGLPGANGGEPWREIVTAFEELGYKLSFVVVDAADYGVPQHRERLIMVGHKGSKFIFPRPTHGPDSLSGRPLVSVREAIASIQDKDEPSHNDLGGMYGHLLTKVPEGLNYAFFTAEMGHPEPVFAWRSKFHDLLYKVAPDEPCRTIKAQPGKFTGPFHWKNRHFTTAELKRLQTFPDSYNLVGTRGKVMEQIGNSVPPRLAEVIATSVREQLFDRIRKRTYPDRPEGFTSTFRRRQRERSKSFAVIAQSAIAKEYHKTARAEKLVEWAKDRADREESYFLSPKDLFDRTKYLDLSNILRKTYHVQVIESGRHITMHVDLVSKDKSASDKIISTSFIKIDGLSKYMPDYDSIEISARVTKAVDVVHIWGAIEDCLVRRSRFFTLIDIYGHYANRGDTVDIQSKWNLEEPPEFQEMLNLFGSTSNCGKFLSEESVTEGLSTSIGALYDMIVAMRQIRFDVRTSVTHPIIRDEEMICTYPFPLLSPRALVESKARFLSSKNVADAYQDDELLAVAVG